MFVCLLLVFDCSLSGYALCWCCLFVIWFTFDAVLVIWGFVAFVLDFCYFDLLIGGG